MSFYDVEVKKNYQVLVVPNIIKTIEDFKIFSFRESKMKLFHVPDFLF